MTAARAVWELQARPLALGLEEQLWPVCSARQQQLAEMLQWLLLLLWELLLQEIPLLQVLLLELLESLALQLYRLQLVEEMAA